MSQEFIPIAQEYSDLAGATGLRPLKENMGHSHAPSSLLLQKGGDEAEDPSGPSALRTLWTGTNASPVPAQAVLCLPQLSITSTTM